MRRGAAVGLSGLHGLGGRGAFRLGVASKTMPVLGAWRKGMSMGLFVAVAQELQVGRIGAHLADAAVQRVLHR